MVIDYTNVVLTVLIGIMFILILFLRSKSGKLFPAIFVAGALMNGLTCAKCFMTKRKLAGGVIAVVALVLLVMAVFSWFIVVT
jgi:hypothetical protein